MPDRPAALSDDSWDEFVARHPHGHVLQTARWARLKCTFGWTAGRVAEGASSGSSLLFRRLPWGQTLAYAPKGPLADWSNPTEVETLLAALRTECARHRAALLKIEPEMPASSELVETLTTLGFRPSPQRVQPLSTLHIDLSPDEATILERMKPKWRYNIRLAERKGVTVRHGGADDLPAIQKLLQRTGARDGFAVHSGAYYARATELFVPAGMATWLLAEYEGRLLAAIAVFALGRMAWYMWGASDDANRNLMPNHALQWAAMRWARSRGCRLYDLWGIPDAVGDDPEAYADPESWDSDGLWGVYRFKQGFGGQVVRYAGAWDLPLSGPGHALYGAALRFRKAAE